MAASTDEPAVEFRSLGVDAVDLDPFVDIRLESGAVLIYDVDNEDAWIQSESAIDGPTMR